MKKKSIYIAYTGGTIGMKNTNGAYQPEPGLLKNLMLNMPELSHSLMPNFTIHEYENLIDSSNMRPDGWQTIAEDIKEQYDHYDGFVILHGTDTMSYTASALSFMLENLSKPVILTGSQVPLVEVRNDARENLLNSLLLAANYDIPEVCVLFNHTLFRGNRSKKIDALSYKAFASPNFPPLAHVGIDISLNKNNILIKPKNKFKLQEVKNEMIGIIKLAPGMSMNILKNLNHKPLKALILESYGIGNAPDRKELIGMLEKLLNDNIIIVNCSQCLKSYVNMESYATGSVLHKMGVISAKDMTIEATLTKLLYLLNKNCSQNEIRQLMEINLVGELTELKE